MTGPVQKRLSFEAEAPRVARQATEAEEAPFLRPKTRTRIRRTRRSLSARLLLGAQLFGALFLALFGVWMGYTRVMAAERLKVWRVEVRGNRYLSEGEIRELLGPAVGENILGLDIVEARSRLSASPWVEDATVRRALPDALQVDIRERTPVALAEVDRLYLMDADGMLIDVYGPRTSGFDLPVVRGLAGLGPEARRDRAERAGALLADLQERASEISEVTVEPSGDVRAVLRGSGLVVRLGAPPYRKRFETFLGLRAQIVARAPEAEYYDLRFRDRILAKLRPKEAAALAKTSNTPPSPAPVLAFPPPTPEAVNQ